MLIVLQCPNRISVRLISVQPKWRTSQEMCWPSGRVYRTLLTLMTAVVINTNCLINSVHQETGYVKYMYIFKNMHILYNVHVHILITPYGSSA